MTETNIGRHLHDMFSQFLVWSTFICWSGGWMDLWLKLQPATRVHSICPDVIFNFQAIYSLKSSAKCLMMIRSTSAPESKSKLNVRPCRRTCCLPPSSRPWTPWLRSMCSRILGSTSRSTSSSSERVCSTTRSLWWVEGTFVHAAVADRYCCVDTSQKDITATLHLDIF